MLSVRLFETKECARDLSERRHKDDAYTKARRAMRIRNLVIKKEDSYMDEGCGSRSKNRTRRTDDAACVSVRPFG